MDWINVSEFGILLSIAGLIYLLGWKCGRSYEREQAEADIAFWKWMAHHPATPTTSTHGSSTVERP